jgi:Uncharacterized conserved protein
MGAKSKPNEISITRIYDAPVKLVWDAWTDPKKAAKWWGPRGHSITTHSKDLRVGGFWKYTMFGPNGQTWENKTIYHEVEQYKKLVYDHGGGEDRPPLFRVTVTFEEKNGKTKMEMTMALETAEKAKETKKFIKSAGGNGTWDRLAEFLEQESSGKEKFVINRSFEAPINVVFDAWTNPLQLAQWLPPTGFDMKFINADIRSGGSSFYSMSNGSGLTMYGKAEYLEVNRPSLLVYTQVFTDQDGKVSRHPMAPTWPEKMKTVIEFASEDENQTRVTVTWEVVGDATAEEMQTFIQGRAGMTQGWTGSLDKLEDFLAK